MKGVRKNLESHSIVPSADAVNGQKNLFILPECYCTDSLLGYIYEEDWIRFVTRIINLFSPTTDRAFDIIPIIL